MGVAGPQTHVPEIAHSLGTSRDQDVRVCNLIAIGPGGTAPCE